MSRQLPDSEVARLNHAPAGARVQVHPWTAQTIARGLRWQQLSAGTFDITEPDQQPAVRRAALLRVSRARTRAGVAVRKLGACRISLDGIAKGFAIDKAVHELRRHGVDSGLVIAGGDLRCFGPRTFSVVLRRPDPKAPLPAWELQLRECALATSGRYFGSTLWNARTDTVCESWTVMAPTATAADALTKVVSGQAAGSAGLLQRYRARAWHAFKVDAMFTAVEL
jgi:FAD:protein FMN transferase